MPSSIPYDPSLTLGNIVRPEKLQKAIEISKLQAPANSAEKELNSLISLKRSLDMTLQEMLNMNIDTTPIQQELNDLQKDIQKAANHYATEKVKSEKLIQPIRAKINTVNKEIETPLDYNKSQIKDLELSNDSLQLNVQYFSLDKNDEKSLTHASNISSFVSSTLSYFGNYHAHKMAGAAQVQASSQLSNHDISGTLVISITCTHKNAKVFAPLILDVDKAVRAWNELYPAEKIKTNDPVMDLLAQLNAESPIENQMYILSGATYGSSFVGMVHILKSDRTISHQVMESVASSMQDNLNLGAWFASGTGNFGVESSFSAGVKNLLSIQNIQSHCTLTTMGVIPSIRANQVKVGVKQFSEFDPAAQMDKLATLQGATATEKNTIASAADAAKVGQQMISLQNATITAALSGLSEIDDGMNSIIDINSMMTAMDDYITKCVESNNHVGVPVNYYLKPLTKSMILRAWLCKYHPSRYNSAGSADDSEPKEIPEETTN
ncbi:MAG: OmpH family outer membrane protein [Bacteroidales bacterium]